MTKIQIINETVKFYETDPVNRRAIRSDRKLCFYRHIIDGIQRKCAIGRCLLDNIDPDNGAVDETWSSQDLLDRDLKPQYRGHSLEFWANVQDLHDSDCNWSFDEGLTKKGQNEVVRLLEKWEQ